MAERTTVTMTVKGPPAVLGEARQIFSYVSGDTILDRTAGGELVLSMGDLHTDTVFELCHDLDTVREDHPDIAFAYWVHSAPVGEWLGTAHISVPGQEPYIGDCDSGGRPTMSVERVVDLVRDATDLQILQATISRLHGVDALEAYRGFTPAATPLTFDELVLPEAC